MPCSDKFFTGGTQKVACRWGRGAEDRDLHLTEQQHAIIGASPQPAANGWGPPLTRTPFLETVAGRLAALRRWPGESGRPRRRRGSPGDAGTRCPGPRRRWGCHVDVGHHWAAEIVATLATEPPPDTALRELSGRTDEEPSLQRPVPTAKGRPSMSEGLTTSPSETRSDRPRFF